jgi:hypothetical protein
LRGSPRRCQRPRECGALIECLVVARLPVWMIAVRPGRLAPPQEGLDGGYYRRHEETTIQAAMTIRRVLIRPNPRMDPGDEDYSTAPKIPAEPYESAILSGNNRKRPSS